MTGINISIYYLFIPHTNGLQLKSSQKAFKVLKKKLQMNVIGQRSCGITTRRLMTNKVTTLIWS